jgi:hypothetical protein
VDCVASFGKVNTRRDIQFDQTALRTASTGRVVFAVHGKRAAWSTSLPLFNSSINRHRACAVSPVCLVIVNE